MAELESQIVTESGDVITDIVTSSESKKPEPVLEQCLACGEVCAAEEKDDDTDVDLSSVQVGDSPLDPNFASDTPKFVLSESLDEPFRNIFSICSNNAQSLKKSINDVLTARQNMVITEVDSTSELQDNLNQKIADFAKVVEGCNDNQVVEQKKCSRESTPGSDECQSGAKDVVKTASSVAVPQVPSQTVPIQQIQDAVKNITLAEEEKSSRKQKNGASKKKGEKTIDQILKSLGTGTAEEKLQLLCKKHLETLEEQRMTEPRLKQAEKQVVSLQREKEILQADHNRMILAKSRLEGLCREMQRQNKSIKEENLLRIKEEEEKRKEVANKFQSTLNDISTLMQDNSKKNITLREENAELATKLKSLVDNYEVWEQNITKVVQKKELEAQLAKAKHAKVNLLLKQETEKFLREKQLLLEKLSEVQKKCTTLATNELKLREELGDYTSKYEEFQSVLSNSSKVFASFKADMDTTTKKIKKLEKETNAYKHKWESSNKALLDMVAHKEKQDKNIISSQQRVQTLEKLCRALQAERNELQYKLDASSNGNLKVKEEPQAAVESEMS